MADWKNVILAEQDARIAALEAQLAEAKEALTAIDGLVVMEINPSNYDHDDVCELNRNASHASVIARDALSTLEASPRAPKVTDEIVDIAIQAYHSVGRYASERARMKAAITAAQKVKFNESNQVTNVSQTSIHCNG